MKRLFSLFLAAFFLCLSLLSLSACGGVSGTYVSESGLLTYEFSARELVASDSYTEFDTVYSYKIEKNGGTRYILLTLKEYRYDGENTAVAAYVDAQNEALKGKEQAATRHYFANTEDGENLEIGEIVFTRQD